MDFDTSKRFLDEIANAMSDKDRVETYRKCEFEELFHEFDDDKNGYLSKGEMAQFIKVVFQKNIPESHIILTDPDETVRTFEHFLGKFYSKIFVDKKVDEEWLKLDTENKGVIKKKQTKIFLKSIEQFTKVPNPKVFGNR